VCVPRHTSEALHFEARLGPFATRFAGAVKGSEAGVNGALIGFWTEFRRGGSRCARKDGAVFASIEYRVSMLFKRPVYVGAVGMEGVNKYDETTAATTCVTRDENGNSILTL
jgi:hypothetical protein